MNQTIKIDGEDYVVDRVVADVIDQMQDELAIALQKAIRESRQRSAEAMKAKCIEAVKEIEADWRHQAADQYSELAADKRDAAAYIVRVLESITLAAEGGK